MKKLLLALLFVALAGLLAVGCTPATPEEAETIVETIEVEVTRIVEGEPQVETVIVTATPEPESPQLEIFHWWTAPGEREAADAMFAALNEAYPEIEIIENPVAGGGGVSHRVVLQGRMAAGIPPDTFQTLGGAEMKAYVDGGALEPLTDLYEELGYADVIPGPLLNAVSVDGTPYIVPLNMHIQNILYYNLPLFEELGLTPPTNFEELMAAIETIQAANPEMTPLALGTQENWGAAFVLDSILIELGGPEYYVSFHKGEIDASTDEIYLQALDRLGQLRPFVTQGHSSLTWDQSISEVVNGNAAMVIMGTWGIGAFKSAGWEPGTDFGAVIFPAVPEPYLLFHPDGYGLAVGAPHPESTLNWLRVVASPELQIPTDVIQGGLFARTDIDPAEFPDPIRQEMQQFVADNPGNLILDQHGSIAPASFSNEYWIVVAGFMADENATVENTAQQVQTLFETYDVASEAAWYQWP